MDEYRLFQDELMHHGIKKMRWGVRRYQNPDGSLTPAGRARYEKGFNKETKRLAKKDRKDTRVIKKKYKDKAERQKALNLQKGRIARRDAKRFEDRNNKLFDYQKKSNDSGTLSDKQLDYRISRLEKEKRYMELMTAARERPIPKKESKLKKAVSESAVRAVSSVGESLFKYGLKKLSAKALNADFNFDKAKDKYYEIFPKPKKG